MAQALRRRARDSKSPEAFRTISEVALELEVPQHVLRFWESKFSQIKPLKRGGGRRYYRPIDVDLLKGIRRLLYNDGYTIKGVQKLLRQHGARWVIASVKKDGAEAAPGADDRLRRVTARAGEARGQLSVSQKAQISALLGELRAVRNLLRTTD